ncbi:MAG: hypothetical protein WB507_08625 [Solirubrobacterales bacterium]
MVGLLALAAALLVYQLLAGKSQVNSRLLQTAPTAAIDTASGFVGVSAQGAVLSWQPPPKESSLPLLPVKRPPASGRLSGTALQQALVLGAAPAALRPHLKSSSYGSTGVDVQLRTGVVLRFGDAGERARKWQAAAAVLADPAVSALDYVNLSVPGRPGIGGSGHSLPPVP